MRPILIDVRQAEDSRDVVHRAVQALVEEQLVVFPTETVYAVAASALQEKAVARLATATAWSAGDPFTLAVKSAEDAWDYVPDVCGLGRRLARRCWPGPVTLVLRDRHPDSLIQRLPASVQASVCPDDSLKLRVPAHDLILQVLDLLTGPIVLNSAHTPGQPPATTAAQAMQLLGPDNGLVLDDGPCRLSQVSSVVRVEAGRLQVLHEGVVDYRTLQRLATFTVVVVCTGNTCRSPMAEWLLKQRCAAQLGCRIEELEDQGVSIMSAGIAAMAGGSAAAESIEVMKTRGLDLSEHLSQPITERLVHHADLILTMTRGHLAGLLAQWPEVAERTDVLCPDGQDIADPIGGPLELYERCAQRIDQAVTQRMANWNLDELRPLCDR